MLDNVPLLDVSGLKTEYSGRSGNTGVRVADDVSLSVKRGETLGVIGESGSGKTALALAIMRLLPRAGRTVGGRVLFDGIDLLARPESDMRNIRGRRIGMIFQDPMVALDPLFTIGDQLAEPLRRHLGLSAGEIRERSRQLLAAFGIPSPEIRLRQYPHQLSGGMLQRIVAAIALSCDPDMIIADEPTTALDPTIQAQFLDLLMKQKEMRRLSIIIVTHDFGVAAQICDTIAVMYAGRIVEKGTVRQVLKTPGHPYSKALIQTISSDRAAGKHQRRTAIPGMPPDLSQLPHGCSFAPRCSSAMPKCRDIPPPDALIEDGHRAACWLVANP
jgi:oligopeptide/dipeptide ABC transporter ATP-binding protein